MKRRSQIGSLTLHRGVVHDAIAEGRRADQAQLALHDVEVAVGTGLVAARCAARPAVGTGWVPGRTRTAATSARSRLPRRALRKASSRVAKSVILVIEMAIGFHAAYRRSSRVGRSLADTLVDHAGRAPH